MAWTHFSDMHSGGGQKLAWESIYIEAEEDAARAIFEHLFERGPDHVTCSCCGPDYWVFEEDALPESLEGIRVVYAKDIPAPTWGSR